VVNLVKKKLIELKNKKKPKKNWLRQKIVKKVLRNLKEMSS